MRKLAPQICTCALIVAAVACTDDGGGSSDAPPEQRPSATREVSLMQAAAEEAVAAGTVRTAVEITNDFGTIEGTLRGEGHFDFVDRAGVLSLTTKTGTIEQPIEMIVIGRDLYQQYPENQPTWYRDTWGSEGGLGQPALAPWLYLEMLAAAGGDDVTVEGAEDVRGVATTRYVVDLSFDEVQEGVSAEARELVAPFARGAELDPFEVWIDEQGLPRRVGFALTLEGRGQAGGDAVTSGILDLYDYGAEVEVEPPATYEEAAPDG